MPGSPTRVSTKRDAQQRADSLRAFRAELERLEREGVLTLTEEQRTAVHRHVDETLAGLARQFDIDSTESQKQLSWGMRIASTVGGLAFGAAVFLFFYRYWGLLATSSQVIILVATPLCLLAAAEVAARRERTLYITSLIALVAFASFVLNLNVLAGIFNVTPSAGGFLAWGLFAIAVAYHFGLRLQMAIGLVCLMVWFNAVVLSLTGYYWGDLFERLEPLVLAAAVIAVAAPSLRRFSETCLLTGVTAALVAMLGLSVKISLSYLPLSEDNSAMLYQLLGMLAAGLAIRYGIPRGLAAVVNVSAVAFVAFLYCRLVAWWWDWMPKYLFFLIIGLLSLGLLVAFRKTRLRLVGEAS